MVNRMKGSRHYEQWWLLKDITPQQKLAILRHPGMTGLLTLSGIPHVEFTKLINWKKEEAGGPISGGVLETEALPRLMGPKKAKTATK